MRNERFAEVCIAEHDRYGGGSVMVWVRIGAQGKTDLYAIENGTLTAERNVNEILDVHVRPYAGAKGPDFILMDGNARAHRARITNRYLEQAGFNPRRGRQHSFVEIDHEIFSTVILYLPLIQEGQLSVSGERMCTILVNRLEE